MSKTVFVAAAPVASTSGRSRWEWVLVQRVDSSGREDRAVLSNKRALAQALSAQILAGISDGYTVHARFVDQTGGGDEAVYHPDGSITDRRRISPKEGMLGPRCFELPMTARARDARRAEVRAPAREKVVKPARQPKVKPAPVAKPKPAPKVKPAPKPKPVRQPKPPAVAKPKPAPKPPRQPKPAPAAQAPTPNVVLQFQAQDDKVSYYRGLQPIEKAQLAKWIKSSGTAHDQSELARVREEAAAPVAAPPRSTPRTVAPTTSPGVPSGSDMASLMEAMKMMQSSVQQALNS